MTKKVKYKQVEEYLLKRGYSIVRTSSNHVVFLSPSKRFPIVLPRQKANSVVSASHIGVIKRWLQIESEDDFEGFAEEVEHG